MISKISTFTDDLKKIVVYLREPVNSPRQDIKAAPRFFGRVTLSINDQNVPFEFDFPENFIVEQCFEMFEEVARQSVAQRMKQIETPSA